MASRNIILNDIDSQRQKSSTLYTYDILRERQTYGLSELLSKVLSRGYEKEQIYRERYRVDIEIFEAAGVDY